MFTSINFNCHTVNLYFIDYEYSYDCCLTENVHYSLLGFFSQIVYFQKYKYPKAVNILKMARESESPRECIDILLSVVQLVQRMHTKRWLMVALTGKNVYIQREAGLYKVLR